MTIILLTDKYDRRVRWTNDNKLDPKHPMDRCGGPYRLSVVLDDYGDERIGDRWFILALVDCWFPSYAAVLASSLEDAVQTLITETNWFVIEDEDLKDYDEDSIHWNDNGKPCDLDNLCYGQETVWKAKKVEHKLCKNG